jgi:hypothetical protein
MACCSVIRTVFWASVIAVTGGGIYGVLAPLALMAIALGSFSGAWRLFG